VRKYKQLRYEERVTLAELWQLKHAKREIAKELGRSNSTISRELEGIGGNWRELEGIGGNWSATKLLRGSIGWIQRKKRSWSGQARMPYRP
jgi:IS30 family transposase